jgi:putative salt-induced outer membrane protein
MKLFFRATAVAIWLAVLPAAAFAAAVPDPIVRMITEAARTGDAQTLDITVDLAKRTNPGSVAEIDALVGGLRAEAESARLAALREQGFFEGWSGSGEIGVSLTSGTSENTNVAAGIALTKEGIDWRHKLAGVANYQKSNGVKTAERYLASYEANYKFSERFFALGLVQWERDTFAGFSRRFTESVGLGYTILAGPTVNWQVSGGPAWRQTNYVGGGSDSDMAARASTLFLWNLGATTVLSEDAGVYLGGSSNTYYSTTALTSQIIEDVSARFSFGIISESDPPPGIDKTNTITRFTLVYNF